MTPGELKQVEITLSYSNGEPFKFGKWVKGVMKGQDINAWKAEPGYPVNLEKWLQASFVRLASNLEVRVWKGGGK